VITGRSAPLLQCVGHIAFPLHHVGISPYIAPILQFSAASRWFREEMPTSRWIASPWMGRLGFSPSSRSYIEGESVYSSRRCSRSSSHRRVNRSHSRRSSPCSLSCSSSCCSAGCASQRIGPALIALGLAIVVSVLVFRMPAVQAFSSAAQGALFGLFPILWIVINALWVYHMTVHHRDFDVLRRSFGRHLR